MALHNEVDPKDWSAFNGRLNYLMQNSSSNSAPKLAAALYDAGLVTVNVRKESYEFDDGTERRKNAIGSIKKIIERHLKEKEVTNVKGAYITAYCEYFGCSADWLLGYSKLQTRDVDVRKICEEWGLSEEAVKGIMRVIGKERSRLAIRMDSQKYLGLLNKFLSTQMLGDLFVALGDFDKKYGSYYKINPRDIDDGDSEILGKAIRHFLNNEDIENDPHKQEILECEDNVMFILSDMQMERERELKISRYNLRETFEAMLNELYPDIERMLRNKGF